MRLLKFFLFLFLAAIVQGCTPNPEAIQSEERSLPDQIEILSATPSTAYANTTYPTINIRVLDKNLLPVSGATIALIPESGSASPLNVLTDEQGKSSVIWNLGETIGVYSLRMVASLRGHISNKIISVVVATNTISVAKSTITGSGPVIADGASQSTVSITLLSANDIPIVGVTPTFSATNTGSKNLYGPCSSTDSTGVSTCTLRSTAAEVKTLKILTPIIKSDETVTFTSPDIISSIAFTTSPSATTTDYKFSPQPIVTAYDQNGDVSVFNSTSVITLTPYSSANCLGSLSSSDLGGTSAKLVSSGVAIFTDVKPLKTTIRSIKATAGSLTACSNAFTVNPGVPALITKTSGDTQTKEVHQALDPLMVNVTDANSNVVPNATIVWNVLTGSGSLSSSSTITNASGNTSNTLTLGTLVGANSATAKINGTTTKVTFTATGTVGAPAVLAIDAGNNQTGTAGSPLPISLSVSVKDAYTNPVSGVTINWSVISGAGSLSLPTSTTIASGVATIVYTLGNVAGANQVSAAVNGQSLLTQTFSATGNAGTGKIITIVSGDSQSANLGDALTDPLIVKVEDAFNNVVENATINWTGAGGTFQTGATLTDALGKSQNSFTVSSSGPKTLTATLQTNSQTVSFGFTGVIPAPTDLAGTNYNNSSDLNWTAVSGATSYNIYSYPMPGGSYTLMGNSTTNFYRASLTNGTAYSFIVRAVEGINESGDSNEIIVTPTIQETWLRQLGLRSSLGSALSESCSAITQDSNGDTYCAGGTYGDLGEINGGPLGTSDAFVMKVDASGALVWVKQLGATSILPFGSSAGDDICHSVAVDDSGFVYCGGETTGNLGENSAGGSDAFVVKLSATDGTVQWVKQFGTMTAFGINKAGNDRCNGIAIYQDNDPANYTGDFLYCAGDTTSSYGEATAGGTDAFVLKMSLDDLAIGWVYHLGATLVGVGANFDDTFTSVQVDSTGSIYAGGHTFGEIADTNSGGSDAFIIKLNPSGVRNWIKQVGATFASANSLITSGSETCNSLAIDITGAVYCGGSTDGNLKGVNAGANDAYVIKLDSIGLFSWVNQLDQSTGGSIDQEACLSLALDADGSVYCGGATTGDLGEPNAGGTDAFIMKLNPIGDREWVSQLGTNTVYSYGDNSMDEVCQGIFIDSYKNIFCAGATSGNMGEQNGGSEDALIMKLNPFGRFQ